MLFVVLNLSCQLLELGLEVSYTSKKREGQMVQKGNTRFQALLLRPQNAAQRQTPRNLQLILPNNSFT